MTGNSLGFVILAFVLYLLMMVIIGALYAKKNSTTEDYFWEAEALVALWQHCLRRHLI